MLFVVLLLLPQAPLKFARLSVVRRTERVSTVRDTVIGMAVLFVVDGARQPLPRRPTNLNRFALGMCTALVALSLVPLIGWAGQVSLARTRVRRASARSRTRASAARTATATR